MTIQPAQILRQDGKFIGNQTSLNNLQEKIYCNFIKHF